MAVNFMGLGDQVGPSLYPHHLHRRALQPLGERIYQPGRIYYEDPGSGSGSGSSEDGNLPTAGTPLIAGVGDGRFLPEQELSYAQAVTILIRVLGYSAIR